MHISYIFSYWIFLWYLLYEFSITNYNPKFAIICGFIENFIVLIFMLYFDTNNKIIILFFIMFVFLKIIPLIRLWNNYIYIKDIYATIILFKIYLFYTWINNKTITDFIDRMKNLILYNKNTLPGMKLLEKIIL
jgi:hypothetical protein